MTIIKWISFRVIHVFWRCSNRCGHCHGTRTLKFAQLTPQVSSMRQDPGLAANMKRTREADPSSGDGEAVSIILTQCAAR
jgi:hypothetical protein